MVRNGVGHIRGRAFSWISRGERDRSRPTSGASTRCWWVPLAAAEDSSRGPGCHSVWRSDRPPELTGVKAQPLRISFGQRDLGEQGLIGLHDPGEVVLQVFDLHASICLDLLRLSTLRACLPLGRFSDQRVEAVLAERDAADAGAFGDAVQAQRIAPRLCLFRRKQFGCNASANRGFFRRSGIGQPSITGLNRDGWSAKGCTIWLVAVAPV